MREKLAYFLLLSLVGCLEYQESFVAGTQSANYYPSIDGNYVLPDPATTDRLFLGDNCKQQFTVPPIRDFNSQDRLYYIWFFDKRLLNGPRTIEPENRKYAVVTVVLDREILEGHLAQSLDGNFFERRHVLQFFVADRPYQTYQDPEKLYVEEEALQDSVYWNLSFSDTKCS